MHPTAAYRCTKAVEALVRLIPSALGGGLRLALDLRAPVFDLRVSGDSVDAGRPSGATLLAAAGSLHSRTHGLLLPIGIQRSTLTDCCCPCGRFVGPPERPRPRQ